MDPATKATASTRLNVPKSARDRVRAAITVQMNVVTLPAIAALADAATLRAVLRRPGAAGTASGGAGVAATKPPLCPASSCTIIRVHRHFCGTVGHLSADELTLSV